MMASPARAVLVIVAVAVGSALAGAAVDHAIVLRNPRRFRPLSFDASADAARSRRTEMLQRLSEELALRPDQRAAIDSIMRHTDSLLVDVRLEMQPRVQRVLAESRQAIESRLDSAQRSTFATRQPASTWRLPR